MMKGRAIRDGRRWLIEWKTGCLSCWSEMWEGHVGAGTSFYHTRLRFDSEAEAKRYFKKFARSWYGKSAWVEGAE